MRALVLLAVFSTATAQQPERDVEHAAVPVRYVEGTVHGFLELYSGPVWRLNLTSPTW